MTIPQLRRSLKPRLAVQRRANVSIVMGATIDIEAAALTAIETAIEAVTPAAKHHASPDAMSHAATARALIIVVRSVLAAMKHHRATVKRHARSKHHRVPIIPAMMRVVSAVVVADDGVAEVEAEAIAVSPITAHLLARARSCHATRSHHPQRPHPALATMHPLRENLLCRAPLPATTMINMWSGHRRPHL